MALCTRVLDLTETVQSASPRCGICLGLFRTHLMVGRNQEAVQCHCGSHFCNKIANKGPKRKEQCSPYSGQGQYASTGELLMKMLSNDAGQLMYSVRFWWVGPGIQVLLLFCDMVKRGWISYGLPAVEGGFMCQAARSKCMLKAPVGGMTEANTLSFCDCDWVRNASLSWYLRWYEHSLFHPHDLKQGLASTLIMDETNFLQIQSSLDMTM